MEIGAPTNFKHITHIGWDESNGFEVRNLPEEWKSLFKAAGVKKKDLENKETAKIIVQAQSGQRGGTETAQGGHREGTEGVGHTGSGDRGGCGGGHGGWVAFGQPLLVSR